MDTRTAVSASIGNADVDALELERAWREGDCARFEDAARRIESTIKAGRQLLKDDLYLIATRGEA